MAPLGSQGEPRRGRFGTAGRVPAPPVRPWHTLSQTRANFRREMPPFLRICSWHAACFTAGMRKPSQARKLLIASVGVATINYVAACGGSAATSGNLVAYQGGSSNDAGAGSGGTAHAGSPTSGNLVAPPPAGAGGAAAGSGSAGAANAGSAGVPPTSGNLVAPPPGGAGGVGGTGGAAGSAGEAGA